MAILLLDRNLHENANEWQSNTSLDVNDPPSDLFEASQAPDGSLIVTNTYAGTRNYAGGLVSNKRKLRRVDGALLPYVGMRIRFRWPYEVYENIARHELDLKVCTKTRPSADKPIRNVANFSTQWNRDTGQFQIDQDPPGWVNTGFYVKDIEPDQWHDIYYRFWFDPVACTFSVLSINLDGELYHIPGNLQNVPMQLTNWEEIAAIQIQNEMFKAGCTVIQYRQVALAWSDAPLEGEIKL